ncbi:peptidoglycan-binding protein [uncultured Roseibium sp.]|uniref:peptidoglycan-binding protein n=1 Tax=uncultured Roseibium sp. TaxID=1936171 RepID=UPI00260808C8|nr:peptidoglycan-binding protein [uncultured Roseibium sp.]
MEESDEDLDAVADELDRLLSEKDSVAPQRSARPARQTRQSSPAPRRRAPARETAHEPGVDDVLGALDRLDEQVQGLGGGRGFEEPYSAPTRPRSRPGRYALDSLREDRYQDPSDPYYDDGDEDAGNETHGEDYYDRAPPPREQVARDRHDASFHVYKDLGRRIDALRAPQEKVLGQVREEIGSLRDALGGISRGTSETVNKQNTELRRLADMVERLRTDKKTDHLAREIRKEVSELKSMVGRTNVEGALETLEHGYAHILQRLDELSRASVDPRVLRSVTARLDEIEDAFAALPRSEHMVVLEDRVVTIAERVEELLQRKDHVQIEPLRAELREVRGFVEQIDIKGLVEGIDDRMKFVSGRLDDLEVLAREQRGLDTRLSAMEDRMPEPETLARLQGRLEDIVGMMSDDRAEPSGDEHLSRVDRRLDDIVERLERMEHATPLPSTQSGAFEALEKRLETISGKIDAIEKKTSRARPAKSNAKGGGATDNEFLSEIQDRLSDLTARLDQPTDTVTTADLDKLREEIGSMRASVAAPASTDALEQRIADLAQVVTKGGELTDDGRFEQLGEKVAALAAQLENSSGNAFGVEQLSPVLERIEQGLQQTRADVAEIARKAATEAVANLPAAQNSQYDEEINALQGDLRRLLDAAEGGEERTRNTFDGVKSVLGSLTERLDNLERPETGGATPAASFTPLKVDDKMPVFAKPVDAGSPEDDRHTSTAGETVRPDTRTRDRKADFIAAARRAAQAASAEAARLDKKPKARGGSDSADEERGKERVGWLRNVLKREKPAADKEMAPQPVQDLELGAEDIADRDFQTEDARVLPGDRPAPEVSPSSGGRRRTILYAAAAVVLLIGTLQVYRVTTGGNDDGEQLASTAEKAIESVEALPEEAETDLAAAAAKAAAAAQAVQQPASDSAAVSRPETQPVRAAATPADPSAARTASTPENQTAAAAPVVEPVPATGKVQQASADGSREIDTDLAFAPPAGVASSFGTGKTENSSTFSPSGSDAAGKSSTETEVAGAGQAATGLIANLPPEGIGPMALRSAAAGGDPAAEFLVGVKYTEGNGVPADLEKAAVWYQKAANKGLAPAQYRLASLYEKGRGVEKDLSKAKAWYMKAAEAGNAKAMHNLAVLFAEGAGGEPDYAAAGKWFENAANYGVKDSLFNLGILYAGGIGVDKNLVASYKWFAIAADQGDPEAAKRRDDVANMMDQEMLANARLAVENFKLKTPDPAANKVTMQSDWADGASLPASQASVQSVDNTAMIREAQDKLNYLGFDTGTPDGEMGPRTRSAISAFQRSLGLPETGEVDARLLEELKSQAI